MVPIDEEAAQCSSVDPAAERPYGTPTGLSLLAKIFDVSDPTGNRHGSGRGLGMRYLRDMRAACVRKST